MEKIKKIVVIGIVAVSLVSCSQKREAGLDAREAQLEQQERIQDSIRIVEETRSQMAAEAPAQQGAMHAAHTGKTSPGATTSSSTTQTEQKKGWSNKAKGAVIGAGVGAVTGAVVDKNHRGIGALIGGAIGAGAGLGAGAILDKKKEQKESEGN